MKKFYVKADVVITDEKIYNGEGKCYIEGVGLE